MNHRTCSSRHKAINVQCWCSRPPKCIDHNKFRLLLFLGDLLLSSRSPIGNIQPKVKVVRVFVMVSIQFNGIICFQLYAVAFLIAMFDGKGTRWDHINVPSIAHWSLYTKTSSFFLFLLIIIVTLIVLIYTFLQTFYFFILYVVNVGLNRKSFPSCHHGTLVSMTVQNEHKYMRILLIQVRR